MKQVTISTESLKPALKRLAPAINNASVLPILKNIFLRVKSGELEMITCDMEITISHKLVAEATEEFELLIPFDYLSKVVSVSGIAPLTIEHPSVRKARIKCGEDVFEVGSLEKLEEFPKLPGAPEASSVKLPEEFSETIGLAVHTVGKEEIRPILGRVLTELKDGACIIVSTDAGCLFKRTLEVDFSGEPDSIQLSSKAVKVLAELGELSVSWDKKQVCFQNDAVKVWLTKYDDVFPNYRAVIPSYEANLTCQKTALVDALNKACINSAATKQTVLKLKEKEGQVFFVTNDIDFSRKIQSSIPAEYTGTTEAISFNAKKMLTLLGQVEAEQINLHIDGPSKAILISTQEAPEYLGLLMPLIMN